MVSKRLSRPFSLATRLTFFISLVTIASFFAFAWIMIQSVKVHFAEQDINDLSEISATLERILSPSDEPESRRLEILKNVVAGYSNVIISLKMLTSRRSFIPLICRISASFLPAPRWIKPFRAATSI